MPQADTTTLARGASVAMAGRLFGRGLGYVVHVLLARWLGPLAYGLFAMGWRLSQMGGLIATLGLDQGLIRFGSAQTARHRRLPGRLLLKTLCLAAVGGALATVILIVATPWLARSVFGNTRLVPVLWVLALGTAVTPVLRVAAAGTRLSQRMGASVWAEDLVPPLAQLLLFGVFTVAGLGLSGATWATTLSFVVAAIVALLMLTRKLVRQRSPSEPEVPLTGPSAKELLAFSLPTALASLLAVLIMSVDLLMVGALIDAYSAGLYQTATQIALLFFLILTSINAILAPMIPPLAESNERRRLEELYRVSTKWGLYLALPLFLFVLVDIEGFLRLYGDDYVAAATAARLLALGQMVNLATGAVGLLLILHGWQRAWLRLTLGSLVVNVVSNALLIPRLGVAGAAIGTTLAVSTLFLSGLYLVRRHLRLWPYDRRFAKGLMAGMGTFVVLFLTARWLSTLLALSDLFRALLLAGLSVAVFMLLLLIAGLDTEDRELLQWLRSQRSY